MKDIKKTLNIIVPTIIVIIFAAISFFSIQGKSDTTDEKFHLVRGLMLIETGDLRLNQHHPYLFNLIGAIPTQFDDDIEVPSTESENWVLSKKDDIAFDLVDINGGREDFSQNVLLGPRVMMIGTISILLIVTFFYLKNLFSLKVATIVTTLLAFDPNFLAHARLVTTDAPSTLTMFLAALAFYDFLKNGHFFPKKPYLSVILLGLLSSFALLSKYTAVFMIAIILLIFLFVEFRKYTDSPPLKRIFRSAIDPVLIILVILIVMTAAYKFQFNVLADMTYGNEAKLLANLDGFRKVRDTFKPLGDLMEYIYMNIPLPFPQYLNGFYENVFKHNLFGHKSFLLGEFSNGGWWYYFPITFLVKEPVLIVLALISAILFTGYRFIKKQAKFRLYDTILILPPLFIFLLSMQSSINLGIRHLLPIMPFIYLLIAITLLSIKKIKALNIKILSVTILILALIPSIWIFPDYITYYNALVGDPAEGYKIVRDSNYDWGQNDLPARRYIEEHPEMDITDETGKYRDHDYLIIPNETLYGDPEKMSEPVMEIRELLDNGDSKIVDDISLTHSLIKLPE